MCCSVQSACPSHIPSHCVVVEGEGGRGRSGGGGIGGGGGEVDEKEEEEKGLVVMELVVLRKVYW